MDRAVGSHAPCKVPKQPRIHRAKRQFTAARALAGVGDMVEQPFKFRRGKISVRDKSGFLLDETRDARIAVSGSNNNPRSAGPARRSHR